MQSDIETWFINRIYEYNKFFFKSHAENKVGKLVSDL